MNADAVVRRFGRRTEVVVLCALAVFIGYTDRVNISVASVAEVGFRIKVGFRFRRGGSPR